MEGRDSPVPSRRLCSSLLRSRARASIPCCSVPAIRRRNRCPGGGPSHHHRLLVNDFVGLRINDTICHGEKGTACELTGSPQLTQRLKELALANGATLYMALLAAFQTLLHRYSGQSDILVGSAMSGRTHPDLSGLMGYFVNPVGMRADFSKDLSFKTLLEQVRKTVLDALDH